MTTTFDLAALVLNGYPLNGVERMYENGQISDDLFFDYVQLWRRGTFRASNLYEEWDAKPLRPGVIEPLAAVAINALLFDAAHLPRVWFKLPQGCV